MLQEDVSTMKNPYTGSFKELKRWLEKTIELCQPDEVHLCDGSEAEYNSMTEKLVEKGTFIRLNPEKWPNSFAC